MSFCLLLKVLNRVKNTKLEIIRMLFESMSSTNRNGIRVSTSTSSKTTGIGVVLIP